MTRYIWNHKPIELVDLWVDGTITREELEDQLEDFRRMP